MPLAAVQRILTIGEQASTTTVTLPDRLTGGHRSEAAHLVYRIDVSACAQAAGAALWIFRIGAPYAIRDETGNALTPLSAGGRIPADQWLAKLTQLPLRVHNGRLPGLFALPPGTRTVEIELVAIPYIPAGLVGAAIGPTNALLPVQAESLARVVAFADAASGLVLVLAVLALTLWTQRRRDLSLLWLAVACGLWGVRGLAYFAPMVAMPPAFFEQLNALNILLAAGALSASVLALTGGLTPGRIRGLVLTTGFGTAAVLLSLGVGQSGLPARALAFFLSFAMVSSLLVTVWRQRARLARWHALTLLAGLGALLGCAAHDLAVAGGLLGPRTSSWLFWGFVLLLIGFAAISGQYVTQTLNRAERSNEELERHVRQKTEVLERSYARLRESEREAARTQERERLLREMHDGLGAQLMTVLRGVERNALEPRQLVQSLQDSLDELRLLMDSADMDHYLPGALAAWRNRWDYRLAAVNVDLHWNIGEAVDEVTLPGEVTLQVMRILQEAATNIIKHAQARCMELQAWVEPSPEGGAMLCLSIRDNGIGLAPQAPRAGARGLKNMSHRAGHIGANLLLQAHAEGGTEVLLRLPLPDFRGSYDSYDTKPRRAASMAASAREEIPSLR